jgi:hypothetical protein
MKTEPNYSSFKGHLVMLATIATVVALFTILDVQISLARLDPSGPATGVHLARPHVAYFFIPVLAACVDVAAVVLNFLFGLALRRCLSRKVHWAALGGAFASVSIAQPISALGLNDPVVLCLAAAMAVLSAVLIRWRYGVPQTPAAV